MINRTMNSMHYEIYLIMDRYYNKYNKMGAKGSKDIEYSVMVKQSNNPEVETGIYRNP